MKVISRNQARAGRRPARAWFKNFNHALSIGEVPGTLYGMSVTQWMDGPGIILRLV